MPAARQNQPSCTSPAACVRASGPCWWPTAAGPRPAPGDLHALQAAARTVRPVLQVGPDGQVSVAAGPGGPLDGGLVTLLLAIRDAQRDGTWQRLKACGNPDCQWAFYDRSHSRAGAWCDMATCGNRIKNRRLRQRQH